MDCIFCRISSGQIPARTVYESDDVLAFLDAFPLAHGHTLVIPRRHYERVQDMPPSISAGVFEAVHALSSRVDSIAGATLIAIHNGRDSGQEIPHVHVHLIPRRVGDGAGAVHSMFDDTVKVDDEIMDGIQAKLRSS